MTALCRRASKATSNQLHHICLCVLKHSYLVDCCGISFCHSCIEPIQQSNKLCPHCNVAFTTCIPDKRLQRSLNDMKVYCSHKELGCEWIGDLGKLLQHLNIQNKKCKAAYSHAFSAHFVVRAFNAKTFKNTKQKNALNDRTAATTVTTTSRLVTMSPLTTGQCALPVQCHVLISVGCILNDRI